MKTRGKPFPKGNPGRPRGARHKATLAIEALLEGEAEAVGRKCIEMALDGDSTALRLVMERISPVRKGRPVQLSLPAINACADLPGAIGTVISAMSNGEVTPEEALTIANTIEAKRRMIEAKRRMIETVELEQRIAALEEARGAK